MVNTAENRTNSLPTMTPVEVAEMFTPKAEELLRKWRLLRLSVETEIFDRIDPDKEAAYVRGVKRIGLQFKALTNGTVREAVPLLAQAWGFNLENITGWREYQPFALVGRPIVRDVCFSSITYSSLTLIKRSFFDGDARLERTDLLLRRTFDKK